MNQENTDQPAIRFGDLELMPRGTEIDRDEAGHGPNNIDRAGWALDALTVFGLKTFHRHLYDEAAETVIGDLLGDLMHLCRMNGLDFDALIESGRLHFDAETAGEP
jgi:hypothetical protein